MIGATKAASVSVVVRNGLFGGCVRCVHDGGYESTRPN